MTLTATAAYLIVGDDPFLAGQELEKILDEAAYLSVEELSPGQDLEQFLQGLRTQPLFGDRRVAVIRGVDEMPADSQRTLIAYLDDPSPAVTLVFLAIKAPAKLLGAVKKAGRVIEAQKGKRADLLAWLRQHAKQKGLKVSGDAMNALIDSVGSERMALAMALEQLSLSPEGAPISAERVQAQFGLSGRQTSIFALIDAVAGRQPAAALHLLSLLLAQGQAVQQVFWTLARHFRMLIVSADGPPSRVASALGIPPWRAEKLVRQARGFTSDSLVAAYQALAGADRKMRTSREPEVLSLERLIVVIAG